AHAAARCIGPVSAERKSAARRISAASSRSGPVSGPSPIAPPGRSPAAGASAAARATNSSASARSPGPQGTRTATTASAECRGARDAVVRERMLAGPQGDEDGDAGFGREPGGDLGPARDGPALRRAPLARPGVDEDEALSGDADFFEDAGDAGVRLGRGGEDPFPLATENAERLEEGRELVDAVRPIRRRDDALGREEVRELAVVSAREADPARRTARERVKRAFQVSLEVERDVEAGAAELAPIRRGLAPQPDEVARAAARQEGAPAAPREDVDGVEEGMAEHEV